MITCYLRSSALGTLEICNMQYFFTYVLGMKSPSGLAASKGTVFHRAMQVLADKKKAQQDKKKNLKNDDICDMTFDQCDDIEYITEVCFNYYKEVDNPNLAPKDLREITRWVHAALEYNDGELDPRNKHIHATELFFDFEIKKDWAKYDYEINGQKFEGYLSLKGTVDLILNESEDYLQVLDYKSGKRLDWATGKEKTYADLCKDKQLLFYYYALKNVYPDKSFYMSIFYLNDGGLFDIMFDDSDYEKAEKMIRNRFEYIKSVELPKQISTDQENWKCQRLCKFSQIHEESGQSICNHFHGMIKSHGIHAVTEKYADTAKLLSYGQGGGRLDKNDK